VVARRIAATLKNATPAPSRGEIATNITLATLKAGDTLDTLTQRVMGSQAVAAE
jgi:hypothetical protein